MADLRKSYEEMKAVCIRNDSHYFDDETISFFGAKVHLPANRWGLFLESYDNFDRTYKLYAVKFISNDGYITSIEPSEQGKSWEHFRTYEQAKDFRYRLSDALDNAAKNDREYAVLRTLSQIEEEGLHTGIYVLTNESGDSITVNINDFSRFICG